MNTKYMQDVNCTYHATLRRVGATVVAVENKYYIFWVCVRSLSFPPCSAHAPYCHLRPVWLYNILPRNLINGTILGENLLIIKVCLDFPLQLRSTSHSKNKWDR